MKKILFFSLLLILSAYTINCTCLSCLTPLPSKNLFIEDNLELLKSPQKYQRPKEYIVKKGDTLWTLSKRFNVNINALMELNGITDVGKLRIGQTLIIPDISSGAYTLTTEKENHNTTANVSSLKSNNGFIWPVKGRILPSKNKKALEIATPFKSKVFAVKDGIVVFVHENFRGYGKVVILKHHDGFYSFYGFNAEIKVKEGENVTQGQTICLSGKSPHTSRTSLHFRLFKYNKPLRTIDYLVSR